MKLRRSAPFAEDAAARLAAMTTAHKALGVPERAGRSLDIRRDRDKEGTRR